ncbi:MAG: hypothetical protein ABIE36_03775 [Candidatus Diapherotrites archaeon]
MFFKQRKKELSRKLEYLEIDKKEINEIIKRNYNLTGLLTGSCIEFEEIINRQYQKRKEANEKLKIQQEIYKFNINELETYLRYFD